MTAARASIARERVGSTALAVGTLRDLGMPWAEIDAILETRDPRLARRYLQLHAERLEEHLAEQRATLLSLEPMLGFDALAGVAEEGARCP